MSFVEMWQRLAPMGRTAGGAYQRLSWTEADLACREWFREEAARRDLIIDEDPNGNQWAWWGEPAPGAVVTGSHLDSVPGGGAFDGPLGIVSAFCAVDSLRSSGVRPETPVAIVNWAEEEGGRWGVACLGSRLLTGQVNPAAVLQREDRAGVTLAEALTAAGLDPTRLGSDPDRLARIGTFVELHIEQGRALDQLGVAVGVATAVWPHGRWRFDFAGHGDHAGTTRLADRRDPVLPMAEAVIATRRAALAEDALATVGRVDVWPGASNAIASRASSWLDARAPEAATVRKVVERVSEAAEAAARAEHVTVAVSEESWSDGADFGAELRSRLADAVRSAVGQVAQLPTGAGHDAAILAAHVPSAMLFVRNPTGVSHDPAEYAHTEDCLRGVDALSAVLADLLAAQTAGPVR